MAAEPKTLPLQIVGLWLHYNGTLEPYLRKPTVTFSQWVPN
jgi:hypothetical protein